MEKSIKCYLCILCCVIIITALHMSQTSSQRFNEFMKMMEYNINPLEAESWTLPTEMSGTTHFVTAIIKPECANFTQENTGRVNVSQKAPKLAEMWKIAESLGPGGEYIPDCQNPHQVAIIVPYRDRAEQLPVFLGHIHPFLINQRIIHYRIYIVNQADKNEFNRASLMNVGFTEALKDFDWTCFIFHDVDHLPEDTRNLYSCPDQPRIMAVAVDKWNYTMLYKSYFGGVVAIRKEHFEKINGVSNKFWGWGGEDDDMRRRVVKHGMNITKYAKDIARYTTIKHKLAKKNHQRTKKILKETNRRWHSDGLNTLDYNLLLNKSMPLFTNITVELNSGCIVLCQSSNCVLFFSVLAILSNIARLK